MTEEEIKTTFESLSKADQSSIVRGLEDQLKSSNINLQEEVDQLRRIIYGLRPVIDSSRKGRIKCIVCLNEGKKGSFTHLVRCPWAVLQEMVARARRGE